MSSYEDDIRRIAKKDKIKGALKSKAERDPILGTVTPFKDDAFSIPSSGNEASAGDACNADQGTEPPNPDDPNTFKQPVPGSGAGDGVPGGEDVYDGVAGPDFNDDETGGDYPTGGYGSLNGLDGLYDCVNDNRYDVRFDGEYPDQPGWDDPEAPPDGSPSQLGVCRNNNGTLDGGDTYTHCMTTWGHWLPDLWWRPTPEDGEDYNPDNPWSADCWNDDGITFLTLRDGVFVPSVYDCDGEKPDDRSVWDLCALPGGGKPLTIEAGLNGRVLISGNGITRVYGANGKLEAAGDTTTAFKSPYLP